MSNNNLFENFYICSECGTEWTDIWDCTCDDRCPNCNTSTSPTESVDLEVEGPVDEVLEV